jgi:hypothetical protein
MPDSNRDWHVEYPLARYRHHAMMDRMPPDIVTGLTVPASAATNRRIIADEAPAAAELRHRLRGPSRAGAPRDRQILRRCR